MPTARRHRRWPSLLAALLVAVPVWAETLFAPTAYRTRSQVRRLLDDIDARVLLPLGYYLQAGAADAELTRRPGVAEARVYESATAGRVEVGALMTARGLYQIAVFRAGDGGLEAIGALLRQVADEALRAAAAPSSSAEDLGYEMLRLGNIEADRALALLKALGYYTIEFQAKAQGGEQIFDVVRGQTARLPWVVKVANASKTSLLAEDPTSRSAAARSAAASTTGALQGAPQLGGSHLHSATSGAPEERLLIVYDKAKPEDLETLVNLLQTHIDVAAQQIVIEALVIEVNTSSLKDLGFELRSAHRDASASFERSETTGQRTGTFILSPGAFTDFNAFRGTIEALQEKGEAEVLSNPSVLVLNDRQARIQVGRQIPVSRTTSTQSSTVKGVEYFPIGIVLNLRPRINREKSEVTMQIETIISSISPESAAKLESSAENITFSPIVDNRTVETYVRVADGTPFIIGGLLSTDDQQTRVGLPLLSAIPVLGRLLTRERIEKERREVIVVLTPHIVPEDARSFSYLIPKDSDIFDRFDYTLFRNAYRVRDDEVWDLGFIQESPVLRNTVARIQAYANEDVTIRRREPYQSFLAGNIPGEEVLVRRMLCDIVDKLHFGKEVDRAKVFLFESTDDANLLDRSLTSVLGRILKTPGRAVVLTYDARNEPKPGESFTYLFATIRDTTVPSDERERVLFLRRANPVDEIDDLPRQWSIVLADDDDVAHLCDVLILKRLLDLNNKLPQTLQAFQPGVQILFPSREDMASRYHLIDGEVARLFYETSSSQYYPAFERIFNRRVREVESFLGPGSGGRR